MKKITVYWKDIPSQVIISIGKKKYKRMLTDRFQSAIDRAAMKSGCSGTDSYLEEWRRDTQGLSMQQQFDVQQMLDLEVSLIDELFDDLRLETLINNGGVSTKR